MKKHIVLIGFLCLMHQVLFCEEHQSPVERAIWQHDLSALKRSIKSSEDANKIESTYTPLTQSIAGHFDDGVEFLLKSGADPNLEDKATRTPIIYAAVACNEALVSDLLNRGADPTAKDLSGENALMMAAYHCEDGKIVKLLLDKKVPVNEVSETGDTALTLAAFNGDEKAVRELLAAGASVKVKNSEGMDALSIAKEIWFGRKPSHDVIESILRAHQ